MSDHPRTIDNGAGEELTFVGTRTDERGEYLEARNTVKPGSGPPMHVHRLQEESLTVERGTMGMAAAGGRGAGQPRVLPHPDLRLHTGRRRKAPADIRAPVQRVVFPVVVAVGRVFGLHKRFAGAPEPVTRTRPA